ncbi:DUF5591 domain-containing protein [Candidatus Poribacteria bacterium]
MEPTEVRYRLISALLQADGPLTFAELLDQCGIVEKKVTPVLKDLVNKSLVVEGGLIPDKPAPQYCWGARWTKEAERRAITSQQELRKAVKTTQVVQERSLDIDSESVLTFYNHIINGYTPPEDKRFLVFLQCSVRRPFSSSPSHASMRRAISVATGYDPRKNFDKCPVHVVVLASKIGPVPYELEDVYPANVRGGGVKHLDKKPYARVKPILAERMAQYILTHGGNYEQFATFTESRYAEVMEEAREMAGVYFPIFPILDGAQILRRGNSFPRTYWEKYWIQLYLEIVDWLDPDMQAQAEARLKKLDLRYHEGLV